VRENLKMCLRLHVAAHDAEAGVQLAVAGGHCRDDRVVRALARLKVIHVFLVQAEAGAAVLQ
jgi:hypothetical protein